MCKNWKQLCGLWLFPNRYLSQSIVWKETQKLHNSVLRLQNRCSVFIGITKVQVGSRKTINFTNNSHPVIISYNCCSSINVKIEVPEFKPPKIDDLNIIELDIANHKLDKHSRDLDLLVHICYSNLYYMYCCNVLNDHRS